MRRIKILLCMICVFICALMTVGCLIDSGEDSTKTSDPTSTSDETTSQGPIDTPIIGFD